MYLLFMNSIEHPPKTNARLTRIKRTSRILPSAFLFYFGMFPLVRLSEEARHFDTLRAFLSIPTKLKIYGALCFLAWLPAMIAITRLLECYEKGNLFGAKNVSYIRQLGILAISFGVISASRPIFEKYAVELPILMLNILVSPWLIAGFLTIIIAWVMDEGRKVQEEQELTV